jgi:hypothetical protein
MATLGNSCFSLVNFWKKKSSGTAWTNQNQELSMAAMFLTDQDEISNLYRGPSIDASYQVSVHLAKRFRRRIFKKISQSESSLL